MSTVKQRVLDAFHAVFGAPPTLIGRAPGRVNLIGEHTDYNDGFVLPCAIDYETLVAASPRQDGRVRVVSADYANLQDEFELGVRIPLHTHAPWANYVRGVVQILQERGVALHGVNLAIAGDVPQGAGLSSSAALEVAVAYTLNTLQGLGMDRTEIALVAQRAENDFVGCKCGIMDQLISARGQAGQAQLIDCRSLEGKPVPLPKDLAVMIVHSRVARGLVDSAYNERRLQCEIAAHHYGVKALRDLDVATLHAKSNGLEPLVLRRAHHVVTENQRTLDAANALADGDLLTLGRLMSDSHASMRDDFEITVPPIDHLVAIAQKAIGVYGGARMTGGGFGGCIVALMPQDRVPIVQAAIASGYVAPNGEAAQVWVCQARDGAGSVPL